MAKKDEIPALSGWMIEGDYQVAIHDKLLLPAAINKGIQLIEPIDHFENLVKTSALEDRMIVAYSSHEYDVISPLSELLERDFRERYVLANFSRWFNINMPELYEKAQDYQKKKKQNKRNMKKKSGDFRLGLKDFLKLEEVGYPDRKKVGIGGSAKSIRQVRERSLEGLELTKGIKTGWTRMLTYLEHDVKGLAHLVEFVVNANI